MQGAMFGGDMLGQYRHSNRCCVGVAAAIAVACFNNHELTVALEEATCPAVDYTSRKSCRKRCRHGPIQIAGNQQFLLPPWYCNAALNGQAMALPSLCAPTSSLSKLRSGRVYRTRETGVQACRRPVVKLLFRTESQDFAWTQ
jgi:hypothetical protein